MMVKGSQAFSVGSSNYIISNIRNTHYATSSTTTEINGHNFKRDSKNEGIVTWMRGGRHESGTCIHTVRLRTNCY